MGDILTDVNGASLDASLGAEGAASDIQRAALVTDGYVALSFIARLSSEPYSISLPVRKGRRRRRRRVL